MARSAATDDGSCRRAHSATGGRRAFTLVELIMACGIVSMLIAMTLPALSGGRESARVVHCKNNLRQLGLACASHVDTTGHYPTGGWGTRWMGDSNLGAGSNQPGGWVFNLLPYLDQSALWELDRGLTTDAEKRAANDERLASVLPLMHCSSRRPSRVYPWDTTVAPPMFNANRCESVPRSDYAINAGGAKPCQAAPDPQGPTTLAIGNRPPSHPAYYWSGAKGLPSNNGVCYRRSTVRTCHVRDGQSYTYLIGEKYLDPDHYATGLDPSDNDNLFTGQNNDTTRSTFFPPRRDEAGVTGECLFGSVHHEGFHVVLCDGRVRTIFYDVEPSVHVRLGSRDDGDNPDDGAF